MHVQSFFRRDVGFQVNTALAEFPMEQHARAVSRHRLCRLGNVRRRQSQPERAPVLDDTTIPGALLPLPSSAPLPIAVVATEVVPLTTSVVISVVLVGASVTTVVSVVVTSGSLRTAAVTAVVVLVASLV